MLLDGESRQRGGRAGRRRRTHRIRLCSRRSRERENRGHTSLRREAGEGQRKLRPGEPALFRDRSEIPVGHRQRQPEVVLLRGIEDSGLRGGGAARLAPAPEHRRADGGRLAHHENQQGLRGTQEARMGGTGDDQVFWRAGHRMFSHHHRREAEIPPTGSTP